MVCSKSLEPRVSTCEIKVASDFSINLLLEVELGFDGRLLLVVLDAFVTNEIFKRALRDSIVQLADGIRGHVLVVRLQQALADVAVQSELITVLGAISDRF